MKLRSILALKRNHLDEVKADDPTNRNVEELLAKAKVGFWSNFQASFAGNLGLCWFYLSTLGDWSRKLAPPAPPIRNKTETNRELVAPVLPRFGDPELAFLISQCLLVTLAFPLLGCCDYWDCFGLCFARFSWKTKGQEDNKRYTKVHAESKNSFNQNDDFEPLLLHLLTSLLDLKLLNTMWLSGLIFFVTIRIARIAWPIQNRRSSLL